MHYRLQLRLPELFKAVLTPACMINLICPSMSKPFVPKQGPTRIQEILVGIKEAF
jgi:hypothetical protein